MKTLILILALTSTTAFADSIDNFIGTFRLVKPLKETERSLKTRGSKCRDVLDIHLSRDNKLLMLMGSSTNPFGSTMNWIELEDKENNQTEISDNSIFQSRFGINDYLGLNTKYSFDTKLELNKSMLRIIYQEKNETVISREMRTINESDCIYIKD